MESIPVPALSKKITQTFDLPTNKQPAMIWQKSTRSRSLNQKPFQRYWIEFDWLLNQYHYLFINLLNYLFINNSFIFLRLELNSFWFFFEKKESERISNLTFGNLLSSSWKIEAYAFTKVINSPAVRYLKYKNKI